MAEGGCDEGAGPSFPQAKTRQERRGAFEIAALDLLRLGLAVVPLGGTDGKNYAAFQRGRGSKAPGPRIRMPWPPYRPDGSPDPEFWKRYRQLAPEQPSPTREDGK